jgi:hypothetical protein
VYFPSLLKRGAQGVSLIFRGIGSFSYRAGQAIGVRQKIFTIKEIFQGIFVYTGK